MEETPKVQFHPDAAARFDELAQHILDSVKSFGPAHPPPSVKTEIHPVVEIPASDIIGEIKVDQSAVNLLGEEVARYWDANGFRVGWEGEEFGKIKELARKFAGVAPIKGQVSEAFLCNETFNWLRSTLERQRTDSLSEYIANGCASVIEDNEIWIPVYQTYSSQDFTLGEVEFRTVSKAMMDDWFHRLFPEGIKDPSAAYAINRERSQIQAAIAARICVKAERQRAREIAQSSANEAVGLLRFLSHVNWTCRIVSYSQPLGKQNTLQSVELFVKHGSILNSNKEAIDQGPPAWNIDDARGLSPGLFEDLQKLAADRRSTEFRRDLYDALQLYSRNPVAASVSHKIVFVIAAIESMLLKDSNEPIQKNLGERMAFLVGKSLDERKRIVANVDEFYRIRSRLIHHGREAGATDVQAIDLFFFLVWWTFRHLLASLDQHKTKAELISALEDRKLS
jgi:hypothetical protein